MKDWDDLLAEKKDIHTPRKAWRELEKDLDDMEIMITAWKTKDGQIRVYRSMSDSLTTIAILEVVKQMELDDMRDA